MPAENTSILCLSAEAKAHPSFYNSAESLQCKGIAVAYCGLCGLFAWLLALKVMWQITVV